LYQQSLQKHGVIHNIPGVEGKTILRYAYVTVLE